MWRHVRVSLATTSHCDETPAENSKPWSTHETSLRANPALGSALMPRGLCLAGQQTRSSRALYGLPASCLISSVTSSPGPLSLLPGVFDSDFGCLSVLSQLQCRTSWWQRQGLPKSLNATVDGLRLDNQWNLGLETRQDDQGLSKSKDRGNPCSEGPRPRGLHSRGHQQTHCPLSPPRVCHKTVSNLVSTYEFYSLLR